MAFKEQAVVLDIALDLGSSSIKICGEVNGKSVFKRIVSKVSFNSTDDNFVVERNGRTLHFGVGSSLVRQDKTEREYVEEQILLAVNQIYGESVGVTKIRLAIGLPLDLYKSEPKREKFESDMRAIQANKLIGTVNGALMTIQLEKVIVCAEGYSGYLALAHRVETQLPFIIIDMGYRTTDVLGITPNGEEMVIDDNTTINTGMREIFGDIQKQFLNDTGKNFPVDIIENAIIKDLEIKVQEGQEFKRVKIKDWVHYGSRTLKPILTELELTFPDIFSRDIYLVGGGATIVDSIAKSITADKEDKMMLETILVSSQEDLTFCNSAGYFMQLKED